MKSDLKSKRLENFIWCCSLESGGYFFGWFGVVGSLLMILCCILVIVAVAQGIVDNDALGQMVYGTQNSGESDNDKLELIRTVICIVAAILILMSIVYFVISIFLIRGTKNRNQRQVKFAVIYFAICAIFSFFGLWNFNASTVLSVIYNIYAFITIYSLWVKFQEDEGVQPEPATTIQDPVV